MEHVETELVTPSVPAADGLFDLLAAAPLAREHAGEAEAMQLAIRAGTASLAFAAVYGAAAGCTDPVLAATNPVKLPIVVVLAVGCALPPGLLVWKIVGRGRLADLLVSLATGVFTATLVLACAAPLIALYYWTTTSAGAPLAFAVTGFALAAGVVNGLRAAVRRDPSPERRPGVLLPIGTVLGAMLLALVQLVYLASPILPEDTVFDHGVDGLLRGR